ncbi:MAG: hypothetical protein KUG61_03910 [Parvibaculaceae bacterium]|nr:hypothetical protein [Parvibaculaceae bacterium]
MSLSIYAPKPNGTFIRSCGYFAIAAGFLEIINGFYLTAGQPNATEVLYVATDLCLLLGLLGWYLQEQDEVGLVGLMGFLLAFFGTAFIAGPSAHIFDVAAYSIGVPIIGVGLLIMCLCSLSQRTMPLWVVALFLISLVLGIGASFMSILATPLAFSNIIYGFGFLGLAYHLLGGNR